MARMSDKHKTLTNGIGACSVPMWSGGCPSGFCDAPAYGKPPERTGRYWDASSGRYRFMSLLGKYEGYVPSLACRSHGGPECPGGVTVGKDGDAWCASGPGFRNIQESPCGFGASKDAAIHEYLELVDCASMGAEG